MKFWAFFFALGGAALNMFQPIISTPTLESTFTGSMYDAVKTIMTSGLPSEGGTVLAILILLVLFLVPVIATVAGLFILFSKSKRSGIILFLCAIANGLVALGIYYLSSESFASPFLMNYVVPYAQNVSFIIPIVWAVCYVIAGVLVLRQRNGVDLSKSVDGSSIIFGIGWTEKKNAKCDLDASAFLLDANGSVRGKDKDMVYYDKAHRVHNSEAIWSTGDVTQGNTKKGGNGRNDLEQIIVLLDQVPPEIHKIVFIVSVNNGGVFGHTSSAYARLVDNVTIDEAHIEDKTLRVDTMAGKELELRQCASLNNKELAQMNAVVVAEIHRKPEGGWGCSEIGEATSGGFEAVCKSFGIDVIEA